MYRFTRTCRRILSLLVVFWGTAAGAAWAQSPGDSAPTTFDPPASYSSAPPMAATPVGYTGAAPKFDELEAEIRQLQVQLAGMQSAVNNTSQVQATPVALETSAAADAGDPQLPPGATVTDNVKTPLKAYWNNGVWFSSQNEDFKIHLGGRIQFDAFNAFDVQHSVETGHGGLPANDWEESQGFRRDRVRMEGTIYDSVDFVWEYDFATAMNPKNFNPPGSSTIAANPSSVFTATGITDMYVTLKYLPIIGNLSVGSFIVPYSFELSTSDRFGDYCERSAAFDAFCPAPNASNRILGACAFSWNEDKTLTYQASAATNNFWDTGSGFDFGNDPLIAGRVTALPIYQNDGRYMLHLGLSGVYAHCQQDPLVAGTPDATQLRARGATREYLSPLTPSITSTGVIDGDVQYTEGAELVAQYGAFSFESELYASQVTDDDGTGKIGTDTLSFKGGYVSLMYMLTGENRAYVRERGCFDRVVPYENYFRMPGDYNNCVGHGAWQVGVRYSYVDLNDARVYGGQENEITFGLNWFLNPNLKFQFNYDATYRDNEVASGNSASNGWINGFGTRMVLDF